VVFSAKLPIGSGTWPALWMLGENIQSVGWPACGEIDMMEHVGKNPGVIHSSIHTPSSYGNTVNTNTWFVNGCSTGFHTYEAIWAPDKIEFRIDGFLFYTYEPLVKNNSTWPFDKPFFLIMNIAMGGNFGSDPQFETNSLKNGIDPALTWARMEIEYVRVYKSFYPASIGDPQNFNVQGKRDKPFISPNPADNKIRIHSPTGNTLTGTIFDMTGKYIFTFQTERESDEVDISSLAKGCYFVSVETSGSFKINKLIIK
jgi:beta-glucanase (GH16 family)